MKKIVLNIKNLTKSFDNKIILSGIDLEIFQGEVTALVGPSGEGKSTLLRCIAGLEKYPNGSIEVNGIVGMVFQSYNLFPNLTVLQNITLALKLVKKMKKDEAEKRAKIELQKMGLGNKSTAYPAQLSGGQSQRIAIARALALDPALILFDEPTSALDPELKIEVLRIIKSIASKTNISILIVTHEVELVNKIASKILTLKSGQIIM